MTSSKQSVAHNGQPASAGQDMISQHSREHLRHEVDHICHMLSEQGPMSVTFVHNNTLLGLQKMQFEVAIAHAKDTMGGRGYQENAEYRSYYKKGRITNRNLDTVMARRKELVLDKVLLKSGTTPISSAQVMKLHLIHGIDAAAAPALRLAADEEQATRKFRADLPHSTRDALLDLAVSDLAKGADQIGVSQTYAGWLQQLFNVDLIGNIRRDVINALLTDRQSSLSAMEALRAMGVRSEHQTNYQTLVAALVKDITPQSQVERAVGLWLEAEQRVLARYVRRNFDVDSHLDSLIGHFTANIEEFAAMGLWAASLARSGLRDPFSPADALTLQDRDASSGSAEDIAGSYRAMERWGGPWVPLDTALRADIAKLVKTELGRLSVEEAPSQGAVERAHLCWIILHDLGETQLNRRGFEALQALHSTDGTTGSEAMLAKIAARDPRRKMRDHAESLLANDIASLTSGKSHADFLQALTGENLVEKVNDYMIGLCSAFMDEGLAAWHLPGRALGFYESWRNLVAHDRTFDFDGINGWREALHHLPVVPVDAVIEQLQSLGVPEAHWHDYCRRLLVNLKGWTGMVFWRQLHPSYAKQKAFPIDVMQYLAVRLFYQNQLLKNAFRDSWQLHPGIADLRQYFGTHLSEYLVRKLLFSGALPDQLAEQARGLIRKGTRAGREESDSWKTLADMAWLHHEADAAVGQASDKSWRLFQLAQFLGLDAAAMRAMPLKQADALIACLDSFPDEAHGPVWLHAFERNYRDEICNAIALNRGNGRWMKRTRRPKSQVVFCIDEREESIHRHYEELDPDHETLGAAGFFGVAMNYIGLDEHHVTPLCPAVVTPVHSVVEVARPIDEKLHLAGHKRRTKWLEVFHDSFWEMKRNVMGSYFLIDLVGFLTAVPLIGRTFFPVRYFAGVHSAHAAFVPEVKTQLALTAPEGGAVGQGFTIIEQADRVEGLLRNTGMISHFAPIVVICAHGSNSQNNPHENAHDCGACGGKHGAPNSRAVSAMANTPAVRALLLQRGIIVPDDTWFIGASHNTASDLVTYFDEQDVPTDLLERYQAVKADLYEASMRAARERCRRFASAPKDASLESSYHHAHHRATDFSQVRPEWGHATNAFAVVGRRGITQGVFFDRRPFIISYDPSTDPTGMIVERILMAVGPVGAGINLEYYFSTVDTNVYGSGTKVPHNVTGLIGVMEGAHSDLRTGLPQQMTEVHEAMRLNLIVDAPMAILGEIYGRQPAIQELLNGEWVILIAHDPETGELNQFVPGVGFEKWDDSALEPIPDVPDSYAWFKGKYEKFLPPARIAEPTRAWTH